jgi:hypothetical protein
VRYVSKVHALHLDTIRTSKKLQKALLTDGCIQEMLVKSSQMELSKSLTEQRIFLNFLKENTLLQKKSRTSLSNLFGLPNAGCMEILSTIGSFSS